MLASSNERVISWTASTISIILRFYMPINPLNDHIMILQDAFWWLNCYTSLKLQKNDNLFRIICQRMIPKYTWTKADGGLERYTLECNKRIIKRININENRKMNFCQIIVRLKQHSYVKNDINSWFLSNYVTLNNYKRSFKKILCFM